jgi:DNA-binding transcriptional ArsR family regulator
MCRFQPHWEQLIELAAILEKTTDGLVSVYDDIDVAELVANARDASELLKALAHEVRLLILCMLVDGRKSVGELERLLELRQPLISQQLARLRADDLVEAQRDGKHMYYSIARPEVMQVIVALHKAFCES